MSTENIDIQNLVRQVTDQFADRMAAQEMADADWEENTGILFSFNHIAANLMKDEPGLEMPGSPQPIPIDEDLMIAVVSMFAEGISFSMAKCTEMGVTGEAKKLILQDMALEVYNQAKQIVACTYGQENTPDFQFSHDQQVAMVCQSAEGHLMHFIGEYERKNGPIMLSPAETGLGMAPFPGMQAEEEGYDEEYDPSEMLHQQVAPMPLPAPTLPAPMPIEQTPTIAPPKDKERYGALALLLTTLSPRQRERILKGVSGSGKEWIDYYSEPHRIEKELNPSLVQNYLAQFKHQLQERREAHEQKHATHHRELKRLTESCPQEKLLSCVADERGSIRDYLQSYYTGQSPTAASWDPTQSRAVERLPSRIEEILFRYLARQLDVAGAS